MSSPRNHVPIGGGAEDDPVPAGTMQAIHQHSYGTTDVLHVATLAPPQVGPDDVLIRVRSASIHAGDWHLMTGTPYLMRVMGFGLRAPKTSVRGTDVAGTVEAVGADVTRFRVGEAVFGSCDGAFADYATAKAETLASAPTGLSSESAATVPTSACTALQALRAAGDNVSGGQVLIIGASGGVGLFAVQLAKSFGAVVTGVCSTTKVDLVRSVGADHVVDYTHDEVTDSAQRYDVIVDLGGTRSLRQLRRVLAPRGVLVLVGGEGGGRIVGGAMVRSLRAAILSPFVKQRLKMIFATANHEDLRLLAGLIDAGTLTPVIDRSYPLSETPAALDYVHDGKAHGKVVITVGRS